MREHGRKPSWKEGHMHEHGHLYTSVPFVMFDEGGCGVLVVWCVGVAVASVYPSSGQTHRNSIPTVVVSLTTHENMVVYIYVLVHVRVYEHGFLDFWVF